MSESGLTGNERIVAEAFERAAARAKGTPEETPPSPDATQDPVVLAEEPAAGRERDPATGQFRRRDDEPQEEIAEAPGPEDGDDLGELRQLWDRYGGDQKKVLAALAEKESMIGRLGSELGDLRQIVQRTDERVAAWEQEPEPINPADYERVYESDGGRAAIVRLLEEQRYPGDPVYDRLMAQWIREEPEEALPVHTEVRLAIMQQQFDARLQEVAAPIQRQTQQREMADTWNQAFLDVASKTPDINDLLPAIGDIAQSSATFKRALMEAPSVQEKARIIEEMVFVARGRSIPSIKNAAAEARQQAEDEGRAQRTQAFVASGSSANREPPISRADAHKAGIMSAVHGLLSPGTREAA